MCTLFYEKLKSKIMERNTLVGSDRGGGEQYLSNSGASLSSEDLIAVGFKEQHHFIARNAVIFKLSRNRHLCMANVGTIEEELWLCESDHQNDKKIIDMVSLHNYKYNGYIDIQKIKGILSLVD